LGAIPKERIMSVRLTHLFAPAAALLLTAASPAAPDRAGWTADYQALKRALETQYANLSWFASPGGGVDLRALDRATRAALARAMTQEQARNALLAFQSAFHDAHFVGRVNLDPPLATGAEPDWPDLKSSDDAAKACAALGYVSAQMQFSLPIETVSGFELAEDGQSRPFRSGIMTLGSHRIGVLRVESFSMDNFVSLCRLNWKADGVDDRGDVNRSALERAVAKAWYVELAARLRWFANRKVDAVLVDIGGNGGGDDSGDIAARLFTGLPIRSSPLLIKKGDAAVGYAAEQLEEIDRGLSLDPAPPARLLLTQARESLAAAQTLAPGPACDLSWVWREQRPWNPRGSCSDLVQIGTAGGPIERLDPAVIPDARVARRLSWSIEARESWGAWSGPVYVLIDGRTASSAEMFAATLQNNSVARVVGVQSAGAGCGSMGPNGTIWLKATRLSFSFPTCVRLRADGSDEVAGIRPDIPVAPIHGESRRARAVRLLATIARDLAGPR
jgi:hypothetical protein